MTSVSVSVIALLIFAAPIVHSPSTERHALIQISTTCFSTGEQTSGMNKICYYNCLGSAAAITVSAADLCPLTIEQQ